MNIHAGKSLESKSQSVADSLSKQPGTDKASFVLTDNRPGAVAQRKLKESIQNSPLVQLKQYQSVTDNRSRAKPNENNISISPDQPNIAEPIQLKPFSFKAENNDQIGSRKTPQDLMGILAHAEPLVKEILQSKNGALRFIVDYGEEGENHGSTKVGNVGGTTAFIVRVSWPPGQTMEFVIATMLHEFGLHVAPAWEKHKQAEEAGTLSPETFPVLEEDAFRAQESEEHQSPDGWTYVLKNALKYNKEKVTLEVLRDMKEHLGSFEQVKEIAGAAGLEEDLYKKLVAELQTEEGIALLKHALESGESNGTLQHILHKVFAEGGQAAMMMVAKSSGMSMAKFKEVMAHKEPEEGAGIDEEDQDQDAFEAGQQVRINCAGPYNGLVGVIYRIESPEDVGADNIIVDVMRADKKETVAFNAGDLQRV